MRRTLMVLGLPLAFAAAACSAPNNNKPASDPALANDLNLAAQVSPAPRLDSVSAMERTNAAQAPVGLRTAPVAVAPAPAPAPAPVVHHHVAQAPVHHTTHHHVYSSGGSSTGSSNGGYNGGSGSSAPIYREPQTVTVKHTTRDAEIGAGAGAIIGGMKGGIKGGIIGGVVGGVLGGVIGNNVDKQTHRVP